MPSIWTDINYPASSLLTSTKMTQNQQNFHAVVEGAAGAPKIQTAALDADVVDDTKIADDSVKAEHVDETETFEMDSLELDNLLNTNKGLMDEGGNSRLTLQNLPTTVNDTVLKSLSGGTVYFRNGDTATDPKCGVIAGQIFTADEAGTGDGNPFKWKIYNINVDSGANTQTVPCTIDADKVRGIIAGAHHSASGLFQSQGNSGVWEIDARLFQSSNAIQFNYGNTIKTDFTTLWAIVYYVN